MLRFCETLTLFGITPEEAAMIALREFMEDVETGRRGQPAPLAEEEE